MCKSSVYFGASLLCLLWRQHYGQIVILKTKIKPVGINAAANCNVRSMIILYDMMMHAYTVCAMFMTELPY